MQEETNDPALLATREIKLVYQENTNSAFIYNINGNVPGYVRIRFD